ncbi:hypothetical protein D3Z58_26340, partial [Clostridiaceae bacterium]|nr:hypothetical protein [Clostridiaceae bacterium]
LAAYLNALRGEGVHVVTVNDYLAQRDAEYFIHIIKQPSFEFLPCNLRHGRQVRKLRLL